MEQGMQSSVKSAKYIMELREVVVICCQLSSLYDIEGRSGIFKSFKNVLQMPNTTQIPRRRRVL